MPVSQQPSVLSAAPKRTSDKNCVFAQPGCRRVLPDIVNVIINSTVAYQTFTQTLGAAKALDSAFRA